MSNCCKLLVRSAYVRRHTQRVAAHSHTQAGFGQSIRRRPAASPGRRPSLRSRPVRWTPAWPLRRPRRLMAVTVSMHAPFPRAELRMPLRRAIRLHNAWYCRRTFGRRPVSHHGPYVAPERPAGPRPWPDIRGRHRPGHRRNPAHLLPCFPYCVMTND